MRPEIHEQLKTNTRYAPAEIESRWMDRWLEAHLFTPDIDSTRESFCIALPPPNVTGSLHMGHALNSSMQDLLIRLNHMRGRNTLWICGTDHAGIATQNQVEKQLAGEGLTRQQAGREEFEKRVWKWREQYGSTIINQLKRMGCSLDYEGERFTLDEGYVEAVYRVFTSLYEKGFIYRDEYMVNWCTRCHTALSDLEVEHQECEDKLYYLRYPLKDSADWLVIATARPETMLGDTAVAVNPDDERYRELIGRQVILPLTGREIPVIGDDYVDTGFGTGALKITPAHDPNDFEIGKKHDLEEINILTSDGRINQAGGEFAGLTLGEAREQVMIRMEQEGLVEKVEPYSHAVGTCYRCGTTIEPYISLQWFMRMDELAAPAIRAVENGEVSFVPERWAGVYLEWMRSLRPWCISRQLWWGHRLPVWHCDECGEIIVRETPPSTCRCGSSELRQEEDVLDTWFSSALWPFATLGWPQATERLETFYPTSVLVTARDIIFLWVSRMIMMGLEFAEGIPFSDVIINPTIMARDGRRMSKSLGTGVDPLVLIDTYGADPTRFGLLNMASAQDVRFSEERIEMSRNFCNKIFNAARFVLLGVADVKPRRATAHLADRWIDSRMQATAAELNELLDRYDFSEATRLLYRFVWNEFCDWYVEIVKPRLYSDDEALKEEASGHLLYLLDNVLRMLHPFMPFLTEELASMLPGERGFLIEAEFPRGDAALRDLSAEAGMEQLMGTVVSLRTLRNELRVPPSKTAQAALVAEDGAIRQVVEDNSGLIESLANTQLLGTAASEEGLSGVGGQTAVALVPGGKMLVPLQELIDIDQERSRLEGVIARKEQEVERAAQKLGNSNFVAKAPAEVVRQEREKLRQHETQLAELRQQHERFFGGEQ
ncbi:MAG: valine--tRNA ligase [Actinomycetota bacterium]|nr:valine--tRNA ligase [Actinomycetota bacterium]MCL6093065.1 valine--tRNA ligase [Actinomycetota bacterium]MDA8167394.1 valine--tRNA ligase [Actinomycetota bacterium]